MDNIHLAFKAYSISNEIDINKIATKYGIRKKYTWEQPLAIEGELLERVLGRKCSRECRIMVFSFGSVVFINTAQDEENKFLKMLREIGAGPDAQGESLYPDEYELKVTGAGEIDFTDRYVLVPVFEDYMPAMISTVLAKSAAMEKVEARMVNIVDTVEGMIERLEKGRLRLKYRELANTAAKIARHEYNSIAYIMILDKPEITWSSNEAAEFYDNMSNFFELNERFEILQKKAAILNSIMGSFSSINSSMRGLFVEWVIVFLIVFEIIISLYDFISRLLAK